MWRSAQRTVYTASANPSVLDVPAAVNALKVARKDGFPIELDTSFRGGRVDFKLTRHAQSIARIPSIPTPTGPDPYVETPAFAVTRHHVHDPKQAGVIVATMPTFRSDGGPIAKAKPAPDAHDPDPVATIVAFDRSQSLEHAGGTQALGQKLAVAFCSEKPGNDPYVQWYDLADPSNPKPSGRIAIEVGPAADKDAKPVQTTCVAGTTLQDGSTLVFVYHGSEKTGSAEGWFYVGDAGEISEATKWALAQTWQRGDGASVGENWSVYETMSMVADDSGAIYLAAFGQDPQGDYLDLHELVITQGKHVWVRVGRTWVHTRLEGASFRAGGSLYVDPVTRGLVLYGVEKTTGMHPDRLWMEEFSA